MSDRPSLVIVLACLVAWVGLTACGESRAAPSPTSPPSGPAGVQISVDGQGFHPADVRVPAGQPVHLVFTRTTDQTCATAVVFPSLGTRRDLPLRQPTAIDVTAPASGNVPFECGMGMLTGRLVVE